MNNHKFFCLEGIEGAGKSTLIASIQNKLSLKKHTIITTKEPGGTSLGKEIRSLLLSVDHDFNIDPLSELLLFFADRAQHLKEVILPAISEGSTVLCDRFYYSTIAYQCFGRGIDRKKVDALVDLTLGALRPQGVILLDLPVSVGLQRAKSRSTLDAIEKEAEAFHEKIRAGFLTLAKEEPDQFLVLDATQSIDILTEKSIEFIDKKLTK